MKTYDVVIKPTLKELIETVNEAVNHGYIPKGGILYVEGNWIQSIILTYVKGTGSYINRQTQVKPQLSENAS